MNIQAGHKIIKNKIGLLRLSETLGSVSQKNEIFQSCLLSRILLSRIS